MFLITLLLVIPLTSAQNQDVEEFTKANNNFATGVYREAVKPNPGNLILSPFSAETVLSLLYFGTKGSTAQQLQKGLSLPTNKETIKSGAKGLLTQIQKSSDYVFNLANKIYVQENFEIEKSFTDVATEDFDAETQNINFGDSAGAAQTINHWVEDHTNNTIKNLIGPNDLSGSTKVVLVNALHLVGNWTTPFRKGNTKKQNFLLSSSKTVQVDFLHHYGKRFNYYYCGYLQVQFLELPLRGGNASVYFALPRDKTGEGLTRLEKNLDHVFPPTDRWRSTYLDVAIPKFKFESSLDFNKILKNIGVTKIFDANEADLSGIAGRKGDLVVSKVAQKAFIDLNENGVEAAAATYVGVGLSAVNPGGPMITPFVADHPFVFWIKIDGVVVFAGRVTEPKY